MNIIEIIKEDIVNKYALCTELDNTSYKIICSHAVMKAINKALMESNFLIMGIYNIDMSIENSYLELAQVGRISFKVTQDLGFIGYTIE